MPNAVPRIRQMPIRRILAPHLPQSMQVILHLGSSYRQQRPQNPALGKFQRRMDSRQALGPRATQKPRQHRLCLIIERMRRGYTIHFAGGQQLPEPGVADSPRGLLNRFRPLAALRLSPGLGRRIDLRLMKGDSETCGQFPAKIAIRVRLRAAQSVVQMRRVNHQPQLDAPRRKGTQQGYRICAARQTNGNAHAGR